MNDFRELIWNHMESRNVTIHKISKDAGIHPTQLGKFMKKERGLTGETIEKIARAIQNHK